MSIPDFQSLMLPILELAADGKVRSTADYRDALAVSFHLTEDDLAALLPSGKQPVFQNRVAWALVHLKGAGLIDRPDRGFYKITERGLDVVKSQPEKIDIRFLTQFEDFNVFRKGASNKTDQHVADTAGGSTGTPEEVLDAAYLELRSSLALELLDQMKSMSPKFFEDLVVKLLVDMGYGGSIQEAGKAIGKSGDGGIDGIIKEDHLGLDVIYIQAKRWEGTVGSPEVQKFAGALQGKHAQKGVFLTTSTFAPNAYHFVDTIGPKISLIDGKRLAELMIDFNVGVTTKETYLVKRVDSDFFTEE